MRTVEKMLTFGNPHYELGVQDAMIKRLRAALEDARRDIFAIAPKAGSRSPLRKIAEMAAVRIERALKEVVLKSVEHILRRAVERRPPNSELISIRVDTLAEAAEEIKQLREILGEARLWLGEDDRHLCQSETLTDLLDKIDKAQDVGL